MCTPFDSCFAVFPSISSSSSSGGGGAAAAAFFSSFFMIHFSKRCMQTLTVTRKPAKGQFSSLALIRHNSRLATFSSLHQVNGEFYISFGSFRFGSYASSAFMANTIHSYGCVRVMRSTASKFHTLNKCEISERKCANEIQKLPTHYKVSFINKIELLNGKSNRSKILPAAAVAV